MGRPKRKSDINRLTKSVLSRLAPLTQGQRVDYSLLVARGIPLAEARAIAQGYQVEKQAVEKSGDNALTDAYSRAYHKSAQRILPDWQHGLVHRSARGKASAAGRKVSKQRRDETKAALLDEAEMLRKRIADIKAEVSKSAPLSSEAHVPVPMGSGRKAKRKPAAIPAVRRTKSWIAKRALDLGMSQSELAYVQAAYGLQVPTESNSPDGDVHPETEGLMQANRLVAGMDAEMMGGAQDAEVARERASRRLRERPGFYDAIGPTPEVRGMSGLLIDIGCGMARAPGWLGLDIFAYDHGTVLHDVEMGLPFPDNSVRGIRLVNALHPILDAPLANPDPIRLLTECQRVLMVGGCLYYEGPEPLAEDGQRWPLPGLVLSWADDAAQETRPGPDGTYAQVLKRVPLRAPAYHGALADFSPAAPMPLELQMALAAYNAAPADRAMANLIHKADVHVPGQATGFAPAAVRKAVARALGEDKRVAITKADAHKRIAYGVVLSADEEDTQGDMISAEEIEKSAHQWMSTSRIIGLEHGEPIDAMPVESFICPMDMTFDGPQGKVSWAKGSWVMGVKFMDPAHFAMCLDGSITGFSVGGLGIRE